METSLKTGFAQIFSCCPKNLSCPTFGGAAAPLAPPARTPMNLWLFLRSSKKALVKYQTIEYERRKTTAPQNNHNSNIILTDKSVFLNLFKVKGIMCEFEIDHIYHHLELIRVADGSLLLPVQLNIVNSHCIHNWPVMWEMSNSLNFCCVGPARWWHNALLPLVRIARFPPASWPVQRSKLKWLQSFAPPTSPGGGWSRIPSLLCILIVLAVAVSSHNLVPHVGTVGMQCKCYTTGTVFARLVLCCSLKIYSGITAIWTKNNNRY